MKKLLITLFLTPLLGFSQTENSNKIIEVYGQEWYDQMITTNPAVIELLDAYAGYGMIVQQLDAGKVTQFKPLQAVPLHSKNGGEVTVSQFLEDFAGASFNPLKYNFLPGNTLQAYKLEGTNWIIYILTQDEVLKKTSQQ